MQRPKHGFAESKSTRPVRRHRRTPHKLILAVSGSLVLSACSTHLYNGENDAAAKAVSTRYTAINLIDAAKDERKNLQEQFTTELESSRNWALARSRYEVAALFDASSSSQKGRPYSPRIADSLAQFSAPESASQNRSYTLKRIEKLGLSGEKFEERGHEIYLLARDLSAGSGGFQTNYVRVRALQSALVNDHKLDRLACAQVTAADTDEKRNALVEAIRDAERRTAALRTIARLETACRPVSVSALWPPAFASGEILQAFNDFKDAVIILESAKKQRDDFKTRLNQKKDEIKELDKGGFTDPAEIEEQLRKKVGETRKLVTEASGVLDGSGLKGAAAVGERLAAIDCILGAAAPAEDASKDAGKNGDKAAAAAKAAKENTPAAICPGVVGEDGKTPESLAVVATIASASPSLIAKFKALKALDLQPAVLARLRAERQRLAIEHDYFKDLVVLAETGVSLQRAYYAALVDEADYFRDIYLGWNQYKGVQGADEHTVVCALGLETCVNPPEGVQGQIIARAVLNYASSVSDARARQFAAKQGLTQVLHLQALRADELAIADWNSLIQPALAQLAAYHASGVKKETVASITQGLINLGLLGVLVSRE